VVLAPPSERQELYEEMLRAVGNNHLNAIGNDRLPRELLTGFTGMQGNKSTGELVIVGRAANGWDDEWYPEDLCKQEIRHKIVQKLFETSKGDTDHCPMTWLIEAWGRAAPEYNSKRSAFWRVVRSIVEQLRIADVESGSDNWTSHLAWSNLYKISPFCGGNPSPRLRHLQFAFCGELLKRELKEWRPKRTLMLTDIEWAKKFLELLDINWTDTPEMKFVEAVGTFRFPGWDKPSQLVVAKHPQGKEQIPFVGEVCIAFNSDG
jgi:hypothetical protein